MSVTLADFFSQMRPYLMGQQDLARTREVLGASPSGDEDFAFYRVLAQRNLYKILRELYGPLRGLVLRDQAQGLVASGLWSTIVHEYIDAHPPGGRHPNCFGEALPEFLAARREREPDQPVIYEEVADFCWVRMAANQAPDDGGDGFDARLFVRQYSFAIPEFVGALEADPQGAARPEPHPRVLLVYRHFTGLQTRIFHPSAAGLVALARRQGLEVPPALRAVSADLVDLAEAQLVEHGVLAPAG